MNEARRVTAEFLRSVPLPRPEDDTDKNSRGTVLVVGGSATSAGAATLSGLAAFRTGAGKVLLAVPQRLSVAIAVGFPEAGVHGFADSPEGHPIADVAVDQIAPLLPHVDAAVIGPGFTDEASARELALKLLDAASGPAFVVDAMSLTGLWNAPATLARHRGKLVITPHAGEMARLMNRTREEISSDPVRFARQAALHMECVVVLKGASTVIAQPDGPLYVHERVNAGLATSGSGDVLTGVLAGLMARGMKPVDAALWSVFLHAQAGRCLCERIGPVGFLARELLAEIPSLMHSLAPTRSAA